MGLSVKNQSVKWRAGILAAGLIVSAAFSGCGEEEAGKETIVIVEQEAPAAEYSLTVVARGEVVKSKVVRCTYTQIDSQELCFPVSGKYVSKVYVKEGDAVKKGDLLAELSGGSREAEIEQLEYQIARNQLLLSQIDDTENYEISRRWLERLYHGSIWETNGIEDLQRNNEYAREDYQDAISLDQQQLDQIRQEVAQSKLYALSDGTVNYIKPRLEGSTSVRDEVVFRIMDSSECVFALNDMTYASSVKPGDLLEFTIIGGTASGNYLLEPYQMENWDTQMYFSVAEGGENMVIEAGTTGSMTLILDRREGVLTLPNAAVHDADGKWYVYVTDEAGGREVKWVEIGLQGNETVEIIDGLAEGEKVILK